MGTHGSTPEWRRIRAAFLAREQRPYVCAKCRLPVIGSRFDVGHVIDRALGGTDDLLQIECWPCSRGDGARLRNALARERGDGRPKVLRPNGCDVF